MAEEILTQEFSICLLPGTETAAQIEALRAELPASPYRDDPPHITLLRGITSPHAISDAALLADIESTLDLSASLPLSAQIVSVENKSNQFYSDSGLLLLEVSEELLDYRQAAANKLSGQGYDVESQELDSYMPHMTIRLGVPLQDEELTKAQAIFRYRTVVFGEWMLLRLVKQGSARLMREVSPDR